MKTPLLMTLFALLSAGSLVSAVQAQPKRDDVSYSQSMPSGCTGVVQTAPGRFVLEQCSLDGTVRVKPVATRVIARGIVQLNFPASHANDSGYYCSGVAPGLPAGYSRDAFECTASGWRRAR
jgi:hypothetical protein